jgi:hypothetical protein
MTGRSTATPSLSVGQKAGRRAPRIGYAVASLLGIFAILGGQLGLSIVLSDGAYQILSLERELLDRSRDLDIVAEDIGHMLDPQAVASLAVSLGMVQSRGSSYLRLSDTAVIGDSQPAGANAVSVIDVIPGEADIVEETSVMLAATVDDLEADQNEFSAFDTGLDQPSTGVLDTPVTLPVTVPVASSTPTEKLGGDLPAPTTR